MRKVLVLMSTYNGEKFIREQLDSLFAQKEVEASVLVRDDGSSDSTLAILDEYRVKYPLDYYTGDNLKPARSFMHLLFQAPDCDYYAFCDQDDVWDSGKLSAAVKALSRTDKPAMYYCAMTLVDEHLKPIGAYFRPESFTRSLAASCLFGDEIAGCTMVFNRALMQEVRLYEPDYLTMHDGWVHRVCLAVGGEVYADSTPYILYRQHGGNVVGKRDRSASERIRKLLRREKHFSRLAGEMLKGYGGCMREDDCRLLAACADYRGAKAKKVILQTARRLEVPKKKQKELKIKLYAGSF